MPATHTSEDRGHTTYFLHLFFDHLVESLHPVVKISAMFFGIFCLNLAQTLPTTLQPKVISVSTEFSRTISFSVFLTRSIWLWDTLHWIFTVCQALEILTHLILSNSLGLELAKPCLGVHPFLCSLLHASICFPLSVCHQEFDKGSKIGFSTIGNFRGKNLMG